MTWSELHGSENVYLKWKPTFKKAISSLLQVLNVHSGVNFSFACICRCSLCTHSLWLVASLVIGKINLLFALYISIWYYIICNSDAVYLKCTYTINSYSLNVSPRLFSLPSPHYETPCTVTMVIFFALMHSWSIICSGQWIWVFLSLATYDTVRWTALSGYIVPYPLGMKFE